MVRQAVLKGKDPAQLLDEMEKIDEMEYNVLQPSPLNEKVLKEKRKKLKETFDRVMRLYHTEDPELWSELKRKELEYEKKRNKRISYFESVRQAESIQIDDIPLPSAKEGLTPSLNALPRIQLPPPALIIPPIPQALVMQVTKPPEEPMEDDFDEDTLIGPSCPPGPPPNLDAMEDLDSDYDLSLLPKNQKKTKTKEKVDAPVDEDGDEALKPPSALQQKMLAISGQNIDDFMKEMENVQRKKEAERAEKAGGNPSSDTEDKDSEDESHHSGSEDNESDDSAKEEPAPTKPPALPETVAPEIPIPLPPQAPAPIQMQVPMPMPNPHMMPHMPMFRPPPMRGGFGGHHHHPGMRLPPRMGIRMPPAPPPGLPPKYAKGPQQHKDPKSATIEAKPQIRNLSADVTRFVPSTLRSKKDDPKKPKQKMVPSSVQMPQQTQPTKAPTKDDAYMQFMKEMQGFL